MKKNNNKKRITRGAIKVSASVSIFVSLACLTSLSIFVLSSSYSHAETTDSTLASVTVPDVCTLEDSVVGTAHTARVSVGSYTPSIGETTIKVTCNDSNGYSLYAVGYSNDTVGNTNLIGTNGNIATGTANDGSVSNWAMKLTAVSGSFTPTILNGYDNYHVVPDTATKVATRTESIDVSSTSEIKTTYAVSISPSQAKGDYTGKVKYTVVHPNMANADGTISYLYDAVAAMSKGTQTIEELQEHIIQPTANDTISSNSGVYEYNASLLGASSDASNTSKIYYYRGILDSYKSDYIGSSGMADAFPNYVKLGITCWRIIRTTGSGGIKMVYNGIYSNTTNGSCANAQAAAAIRTTSTAMADNTESFVSSFTNKDINEYGSIVGVGYTRDNTYASSSVTTATEYGAIFGTNLSYSNNSTNSIIKNDIETWFTNNLIQYESKLEPSAGFCNDRTINIGNEWEIPMTDEMLIDHPRSVYNDNADYYFGAYIRNKSEIKKPSLACPRNNADLYTAPSATNGNKQLNKPVALLTVDEMNLAGARAETGDWYLKKMYLNSGSDFWLLSPSNRSLNGNSYGFYYSGSSAIYLNNVGTVSLEYGVRPVISLKPGAVITGGSGTATDPWTVQ